MRILLVGTDLASVHADAGALELLLTGWAAALCADHDVWIASVPAEGGAAAGGLVTFERPADLAAIEARLRPDVVVVNNRPGWQVHLRAPTVHLLHNWPDAWGLAPGEVPDVGEAGLAAVSPALARTVDATFGRGATDPSTGTTCDTAAATSTGTTVVDPWIDPVFLTTAPAPEPGTVLFPNRLMAKKGVVEVCAAAGLPLLAGCRVLVTDHLSPWRQPTPEHRRLRELVVRSPRCQLIPPARGRGSMAALYARSAAAVCPSIRPEGLGLSAIEAQAATVPLVSSGLGGLAEATLLPHLVVDPQDPEALAGAMVAAMEVRVQDRLALRAAVAGRYDLAASTRTLLAAIATARPAGR